MQPQAALLGTLSFSLAVWCVTGGSKLKSHKLCMTLVELPHSSATLCLLLPPCFPQAGVDKTSWVMESTKSISRLKTKRAVSPSPAAGAWEEGAGAPGPAWRRGEGHTAPRSTDTLAQSGDTRGHTPRESSGSWSNKGARDPEVARREGKACVATAGTRCERV